MKSFISDLWKRKIAGQAGFSLRIGSQFRTDATAWAVMALSAAGEKSDSLRSSRISLAMTQKGDGSIPLSADYPDAIWPTPLAILAWKNSPEFSKNQNRASDFLLNATGSHWPKKTDSPLNHNTALKGWPWIVNTHSWIEPTALAIIALRVSGFEKHKRTHEAVEMIMDRQLPAGGWNYGNTIVFGKELYPFPESTGMAISALAGLVSQSEIKNSLDYLTDCVNRAQTPLTLGWGLLALGAYKARPDISQKKLLECLNRQKVYGPYDTCALSLIILTLYARKGLIELYK